MVLLITYDLHNPGRDYDDVIKTIQSVPNTHPQGSVWLIDTSSDPAAWRDKLKAAGDPNDEYFVIRLSQNWASLNMDEASVNWLKSSARNW